MELSERLEDVFASMGFTFLDAPEVESLWYHFDALNMPPGHPVRDHDLAFYLGPEGDELALLRGMTSPAQPRAMALLKAPLRVITAGRVYRREASDASHSPFFHQFEALVVERRLSVADLMSLMAEFAQRFFDAPDTWRVRPQPSPFVRLAAELDARGPDGAWLEIGGCGMVDPRVLRGSGLDPAHWQGFALGIGLDRLAMVSHDIPDIQSLYPMVRTGMGGSR